MNYRKVYMKIISEAKSENRKKNNGVYYEQHHILPKAISLFPLWSKRKSNIVLLTAREHFICHQMLAKIYGSPMIFALWRLSNDRQNKYCVKSSKTYEIIKQQFAKENGKIKAIQNKGLKRTDEQKKRYSECKKGIKLSKEHIKNIGIASKNKFKNEDFKKRFSESMKIKFEKYGPAHTTPHTKESKEKMRQASLGCKWWNNGVICKYCKEQPEGFKLGRIGWKK